jgi:tRNA (Thr-GGU) A37 N-methylase
VGTRSPARPNPRGLHPVTVSEIDPASREGYGATNSTRVKIGSIPQPRMIGMRSDR